MGNKPTREVFVLRGWTQDSALDFLLHMDIIKQDEYDDYRKTPDNFHYENFQSLLITRMDMFNNKHGLNWFVNIDQNDMLGIFVQSELTELESDIHDTFIPEIENDMLDLSEEIQDKLENFTKSNPFVNVFYIV